MAIFLSKRLLRLTVLVGICLGVLFVMSPRNGSEDSAANYISNLFPPNLDISGGKLFNSQSDATSEEDQNLEDQRYEAEEAIEKQQQEEEEEQAAPKLPVPQSQGSGETGKTLSETVDEEPSTELQAGTSAQGSATAQGGSSVWEFMKPSYAKKGTRPKACFVSLVRNEELYTILESIEQVEKRFNKQFQYPWVFLNDKEFTEEFKTKVSAAVSGGVEFELIPVEDWSYPEFVDQEKAARERNRMAVEGIIYGESESYRHMCRFQSGFFWRQKALEKYDWYWRVEPSIKLYCDITYDLFQWMQDNDKAYGFTITIHEYVRTIESLWDTVKSWWKKNPQFIAKDNLLKFISNDDGETYNLCHFWSNFEVANLNLWRSPAYQDFFSTLDETGNFFYERWGDAPVHSIAAALILPKDKIHYFSDVGYHHMPYDNCPLDRDVFKKNKCRCDPENDFTFHSYACGVEYYNAQGLVKPDGWENYHN
ncbi:KRE2 (YDR483W) and KTR6 (YPL053C) [Zygosaccharomyces parabailii]|uniref:ZYBA0S09-04940g1_1 n=1 Tax=Zygosaccharomyces bailii (strain CLIB 213 / ATCC 58445 / CBS 680 / BCRC 21525 / NBRC 1098 / NCYC 1416 / NRRL Y-2227) TaxID=1333698 RepID=A0A8J2T938_ZYGB2|nr:KRE2 (YDR483W) and KTR6 (YPL053C) [Zygosaccharomyces parabailii]CDF91107.1 ZYBA0S09-04940g1_1 [Zygosaccharomyces bailii CLIB 213]CDH14131.1 related to Glycolipid 2-alpha-mannosyltransferase [Zygosaccharomyces bailii ISA1307]SJM86299.1 related to Glycolipid 2-alpha-mannosyltransferase [Zygosaccharomyces bailii]